MRGASAWSVRHQKEAGRPLADRDERAGSQERALVCGSRYFASKDMPGRQRHIQGCVDQILAKVDPKPAAS
jgi:hypothetical protein